MSNFDHLDLDGRLLRLFLSVLEQGSVTAAAEELGLTQSAVSHALATGSVLKMIEAGGNAYYLAKLAGILGLGVQDIGAQQTGMSVEAFKKMVRAQGD